MFDKGWNVKTHIDAICMRWVKAKAKQFTFFLQLLLRMLMKPTGGKLCKEETYYGWICKCVKLNLNHSYCNGYVCKCVWLTPYDSTCHEYDVYLKWRDELLSSTGALAQDERWLTGSFCRLAGYTVNSNTGCFEVGPAVVCYIAILKKAQQGHRSNVSLRYDWFWEM